MQGLIRAYEDSQNDITERDKLNLLIRREAGVTDRQGDIDEVIYESENVEHGA